jgi:hypothetical protein
MDLELVPILLAKCQDQLFPLGWCPVLLEFPPNSAPLFSEGQPQAGATYLYPYVHEHALYGARTRSDPPS